MKSRLLLGAVVVVIVGAGAFMYLTRQVSDPSVDLTKQGDSALAQEKVEGTDLFVVDALQSSAQFELDELLSGKPVHVVGVTNQVSGEVLINMNQPSASKIGTISINARTFKTDNERRNNAIARFILRSEDPANEFITFEPISLEGMPESITPGQEFSFKINGNMTVSGVTKPVVFDTKVKVNNDNLTGEAKTKVLYKDFGLTIPELSFLADVSEEVVLTFAFVAKKQ